MEIASINLKEHTRLQYKGLGYGIKTDWKTPKEVYDGLDAEFHFDFDPCPINPTFNGLSIEWGQRNFINPPYGKAIRSWLEKGLSEMSKGKLSVFLLPVFADLKWFHEIVLAHSSEIRFLKGRLRFERTDGKGMNGVPYASMIVVFTPKAIQE